MADRSATPAAERVHIAFFGRRNAGKSSLVNALTGQSVAIVSPVAGTTTDPVRKSMELLPLGPVVMIDTPGLDDEGEVGSLRVGRALRELNRADIAVLVVDAATGMADEDRALLERFEQKGVPHLTVFNKCDLRATSCGAGELAVSARTGEGVEALKEALKGSDIEAIKAKQEDLQKAFYAISEKVYKDAAAAGQAAGAQGAGPDMGGQPAGGGNGGDDNVVDAEYKEV